MQSGRQSRDRVLADRLWDHAGREWTTSRSAWLTAKDVNRLVKRDQRIAVHGSGRSITWLEAAEERAWWEQAKHHLEVPGSHTAEPDSGGRTWGAHLWRSDQDVLLGFETFC